MVSILPLHQNYFSASTHDRRSIEFSEIKVTLLKQDKTLSPREKVNLLLILLGKKWLSEVGVNLTTPEPYRAILEKLDLPFQIDEIDGHGRWITVGANKAVLKYINERRDELSEIEAGVLYGYPVTHVLAFAEIINSGVSQRREVQDY